MQPWQYLAGLSGAIIATVMALASVSYNATLGTAEPAFAYLPVTNAQVFAALALAFDLGMVASVFGFLHWRDRSKAVPRACVAANVGSVSVEDQPWLNIGTAFEHDDGKGFNVMLQAPFTDTSFSDQAV